LVQTVLRAGLAGSTSQAGRPADSGKNFQNTNSWSTDGLFVFLEILPAIARAQRIQTQLPGILVASARRSSAWDLGVLRER
jgi:hypothetical protein